MVVADVIADVVRVERGDSLAQEVRREANLDAHLICVDHALGRFVEEGCMPEPIGLEGEELQCLCGRAIRCLTFMLKLVGDNSTTYRLTYLGDVQGHT